MKSVSKLLLSLGVSLCYMNLYAESNSVNGMMNSETNTEITEESGVEASDTEIDPTAIMPPKALYPEGLIQLGRSPYFSPYAVTLDKSKRTLYLWTEQQGDLKLVVAYPSDYGRKPGDKLVLGDLKTPEGIYFFENVYTQAQLNYDEYGVLAFTMNYPNFFDKKSNKSGSGIWLHSIPPHKSLLRGSRGCVVVRIDAIENLKKYISTNTTPMIIYPEMRYQSKTERRQQQQEALSWLSQWKSQWESQNLDGYIDYYADDFKSQKMNKEQWREYKSDLNKKYQFITVKVESPVIFKEKDRYVIRFLQTYSSDHHTDFGEKILYLKKKDAQLKIIGEKWQPISKEKIVALKKSSDES